MNKIRNFLRSIMCLFLKHEYRFSKHLEKNDRFNCIHCNKASYRKIEQEEDIEE